MLMFHKLGREWSAPIRENKKDWADREEIGFKTEIRIHKTRWKTKSNFRKNVKWVKKEDKIEIKETKVLLDNLRIRIDKGWCLTISKL